MLNTLDPVTQIQIHWAIHSVKYIDTYNKQSWSDFRPIKAGKNQGADINVISSP